MIQFLRQGDPTPNINTSPASEVLTPCLEWNMEKDLGTQLHFPSEITSTTLQPDIVLWTTARKSALLVELTGPWEEGLEATHKRKRAEGGWSMRLYLVEVGASGFVGDNTSAQDLGLRGAKMHNGTREITVETDKYSFWLWLKKHDKIKG